MRWSRSARAIVELAVARQRARPARSLVVALGVAAAAAVLVAVLGGGVIAADLRQRADLRALPDDGRAFRVTLLGTAPEGGLGDADRAATGALAPLARDRPIRSVAYRDTDLGGQEVAVGAVEDVGRWVTMDSGRLPGACTPDRCEVVQVVGRRFTPQPVPGATLVVVGTGRMTSAVPFGADRLRRSIPLLVGSDTDGLSGLPGLGFVYRSTTWTAPLAPEAVHPWQVDDVLARTAASARSLAGKGLDIQLTGPDRELVAARDAGRTATGRLLLIGAAGAALVVAFALLAASMLRADHDEDRRRLELRGASRGQRLLFTAVERGWVSLAGLAIGVAAGAAIVAGIARASDLPAAGVLRHSLLTPTGSILLAGTWVACAVLLVFAGSGSGDGTRVGPFRGSDLIAAGAVVAAALAAARGGASPERLASGDVDPLLPALPLLIVLAAGALALRVTGPLLRRVERLLGGRGGLAVRLAVLAQARHPRRVAMTVAFLVVAIGLAIFASGYRATLTRGQHDQADFSVPADLILRSGPSLVAPLDVASLDQLGRDGDTAMPVIRSAVSIVGVRSQPIEATLLGLPAGALGRMRGWREDFADRGRGAIAADLQPDHGGEPAGIALPPDAGTVSLDVHRSGKPAVLSLVAKLASGRSVAIPLGTPRAGDDRLTARVPAAAHGARLIGLRFLLDAAQQIGSFHAEAEGHGAQTISGRVTITGLHAGDMPLGSLAAWVAQGGATIHAGRPGTATVAYRLATGQDPVIRPASAADREPLPLLVSSDVAEAAGIGSELVVRAGASRSVRGRIVAAARRFPTLGDDTSFVVADVARLESALDAADPGAGRANEVWITGGKGRPRARAAEVTRPPLDRLSVTSNDSALRKLERDPLARGALLTLWGVSAIALVLGIAALALASATDVRDERRELADLEAQGLSPRTLRQQLRLRGAVPLALGTLGGLVLGVVLVALVVRLVLLTAGSETPVPPLVRQVGWPLVTALLTGYVVVAALVVANVTWRASRRGAPT